MAGSHTQSCQDRPRRLLVDAHLDLGWNALLWNRDMSTSAHTIRTREASLAGKGRGEGQTALPDIKRAGIGIAFTTTLARCTGTAVAHVDYLHPAQAFASARGQLAYYQALERTGLGKLLLTPTDLEHHLKRWHAWRDGEDSADPGLGMAVCMESADPILEPAELDEWVRAGVWLVGPAHYGLGRYCGGTGCDEGFTAAGLSLLERMHQLGVTLDVTHLSDPALDEALARFPGRMLASHSNCRQLVSHQRQLSDTQLRALIERDAVVGAAMDVWMLEERWIKGTSSNAGIGLAQVADHVDHICQLAGNTRHVGIGSDLDGGFGRSQGPHDVDTIADIAVLADILAGRGYAEADLDAVCHGNFLRLLRSGLADINHN